MHFKLSIESFEIWYKENIRSKDFELKVAIDSLETNKELNNKKIVKHFKLSIESFEITWYKENIRSKRFELKVAIDFLETNKELNNKKIVKHCISNCRSNHSKFLRTKKIFEGNYIRRRGGGSPKKEQRTR